MKHDFLIFCSIEAADKMTKNESRMREIAKEREVMIQRFTQLKKNREAAMAALEARVSVIFSLVLLCNQCGCKNCLGHIKL